MSEKTELEKKFEELFNDWRSEQEKESSYDYIRTGIAKASFTKDGIVDENVWNGLPKGKKVLYILREANGSASEMGPEGKIVDGGEFWFQKCVTGEETKVTDNIFQRIKEMQIIIQKYGSEAKPDKEILREVAYMNLNKRGGGAAVDWKIFNAYIEEYKEYIKKEIAIIKPDIIVCCGTYWSLIDNVCGLYKNGRAKKWRPGNAKDFYYKDAEITNENREVICEATVINIYHPSARISKKDYLERFECIYHRAMNDDVKDNSELPVLSKEEICEIVNKMDENTEEFCELCDLISNIEEVYKVKKRKLEADK